VGEYFRQDIDPEIWIRALPLSPDESIVVDDMRHLNEFAFLKENGFLTVRIQISPIEQQRRLLSLYGDISNQSLSHLTETALDDAKFDFVMPVDLPLDQTLSMLSSLISRPVKNNSKGSARDDA
jgi:hypothetical protein